MSILMLANIILLGQVLADTILFVFTSFFLFP